MAVECCTGQSECTLVVTIGYLKNFIGNNIQTTGGTTVSVTTPAGRNDNYAPTYTELTNGSILPKFVDGGTNRWASNVDGITINGTYGANESVKQTDLVLTYTRFKSLAITAGKTRFNTCGDETSLSYVFTLTKTVKYMRNNCVTDTSSSDGYDTTNSSPFNISYITGSTWLNISGSRLYAYKNSSSLGYANERSTTVYGRIRYKGSNRDSNSVTIVQNALTGYYDYSASGYVSKTKYKVEVMAAGPTTFDCAGGTFGVTSTGYYYETYMWVDNCGDYYQDITDDVYKTETWETASGSFEEITCPTTGRTVNNRRLTIYYGDNDEFSDYEDFVQECYIDPDDCEECSSYREWGTTSFTASIGACGGVVTVSACVPYIDHRKYWEDGVCKDETTPGCELTTYDVSVGDNPTDTTRSITGTKERISYTITQSPGPDPSCCTASTSYSYGAVEVPCTAATSVTVTVPWTATTIYEGCHYPSQTSYGSNTEYVTNLTCNSGSDRQITGYYFPVIQKGGCSCPCTGESTTYVYGSGNISCESAETKTVAIPYTATTEYDNCPTQTAESTTNIVFNNIPCNSGSAKTHTVTYQGKTYSVIQAGGCDCDCRTATTYTFEPQNIPCSSAESLSLTVKYSATTTYEGSCAKPAETVTANTSITLSDIECNAGAAKTWTATTSVGTGVTITQAGGCTCSCIPTRTKYEFEPLNITCDAVESSSYTVQYSATTYYENCPSATTTATTSITLSDIECNSGDAKTWTATTTVGSGVTVTQAGNCQCGPECVCSMLEGFGKILDAEGSSSYDSIIASYDITDETCIDNITITEYPSPSWIWNVTLNTGEKVIRGRYWYGTPDAGVRKGIITLSYTAGEKTCSTDIEVIQGYDGMTCEDKQAVLTGSITTSYSSVNPGDVITTSFESVEPLYVDNSQNKNIIVTIDNDRRIITYKVGNNPSRYDYAYLYIGPIENNCYVYIRFDTNVPDCSCNFTLEPINGCVPYENNFYSIAETNGLYAYCSASILQVVEVPDWIRNNNISITQDNANIIGFVSYNDTGEQRTGTVKLILRVNGAACVEKSFTVTQCPEPCTCTNMAFSANTTPSIGTNVTTQAIEFKASGYEEQVLKIYKKCGIFSVQLESGSEYFDFAPKDSETYGYYYAYSIIPKSDNTSHTTERNGTIRIVAKDSSGNTCANMQVPLKQDYMPCTCESITEGYFFTMLKETFPYKGTTARTMVASASTSGCGEVIVSTQSNMFVGGSIQRVDKGDDKYEFWVEGITSTNIGRSTGINVILKVDGVEYDCGNTTYYIRQTEDACLCEDIDIQFNPELADIDCRPYNDYDTYLSVFYRLPQCVRAEVSVSEQDWASLPSSYDGRRIRIERNNTDEVRTATITAKYYLDGNYYCGETSTTITQKACVECSCDNTPDFYLGDSGKQTTKTYTMPVSGDTLSICIEHDGELPNGCDGYSHMHYTIEKYDDEWPTYTTPTMDPQPMGEWLTGFYTSSEYVDYNSWGEYDPLYHCIKVTAPVNNIYCVKPGEGVGIWPRSAKFRIKMYDDNDTLCDTLIATVEQAAADCSCEKAYNEMPKGSYGGVYYLNSDATYLQVTANFDAECDYTMYIIVTNNCDWIDRGGIKVIDNKTLYVPFTGPNTGSDTRDCTIGTYIPAVNGSLCDDSYSRPLRIIQYGCTCSEFDRRDVNFNIFYGGGFKDCGDTWHPDIAYFTEHTGDTSQDVGEYGAFTYTGIGSNCLTFNLNYSSDVTGYEGLITPTMESNGYIYIEINTGETYPLDTDAINYNLYITVSDSSGECSGVMYDLGYFTLYPGPCVPGHVDCEYMCYRYSLNSLEQIESSLTRNAAAIQVAHVDLPTGDYAQCLYLTVASTSRGITTSIDNNGYIWAQADSTAPNAPTIDIHVFNNYGGGKSCGDTDSHYRILTFNVVD